MKPNDNPFTNPISADTKGVATQSPDADKEFTVVWATTVLAQDARTAAKAAQDMMQEGGHDWQFYVKAGVVSVEPDGFESVDLEEE